ncbi:MAG TPA: prefoldin subunit beta [Candidatus Nanoarchaeia archaeon]|nr:prefoldin subunit beta [Candidatus Nanoarchaeia archaeon]
MDHETEKKIADLQALEQNMQNFLMQRQTIQAQQMEVENALEELGKAEGGVYRILGPIMVAAKKEELKKELESKREVLALRVKSVEKQESQIREKAQKTQAEVLAKIQKEEKK